MIFLKKKFKLDADLIVNEILLEIKNLKNNE